MKLIGGHMKLMGGGCYEIDRGGAVKLMEGRL